MQNVIPSDRMTFAGDEAGDVSFTFARGASTHFVLAFVATAQPDALVQALVSLRQKRGLPANFEFKYHRLSSVTLRRATFETLKTLEFTAWALLVAKRDLPAYWRSFDAHDFYALLATELILRIPLVVREGSTLMLDEFDPNEKALLTLKRSLKRRQVRRGFRKMINVRSVNEPLVQIADLIAGAVLSAAAHGDSTMLNYISNHLALVHRFEPN